MLGSIPQSGYTLPSKSQRRRKRNLRDGHHCGAVDPLLATLPPAISSRGAATMTTMMTTANKFATSKQVRESSDRELTQDELAHVSGGIIAILVGMRSSSAPQAGSTPPSVPIMNFG